MKSKLLFIYAIIFMALTISSCSEKENVGMIGESEETMRISDYAARAVITPLQKDSSTRINDAQDIIRQKDCYYVLDNTSSLIVKYGLDGSLMGKINKRGHGNGEYIKIMDYDVDETTGNLYLLCMPNKIFVFSSDLSLKETIELSIDYECLACHDGKIYLYSYYGSRLVILDNGNEQKIQSLPETRAWIYGTSKVFHKVDGHLLFTPETLSSIYEVKGTSVDLLAHFGYKNEESVTERLTSSNLLEGEDNIKYSFPIITDIVGTGNNLVINYRYGIISRMCVYDTKKNKVVKDGRFYGLIPFPFGGDSKSWYGTCFLTEQNFPVDTTYIEAVVNGGDSDNEEQLSLLEYELK